MQGRLDGLNIFAARAGTKQTCRNYPRIIEQQPVTCVKKRWKVYDLMISQTIPWPHQQKPRAMARLCRT